MYIEIHNHLEMSQKVLYFKLNNSFNMEIIKEENLKLAGIYAIFKDGICLYVGQSKNLASRIATHLKGKYENADYVCVWNIEHIGFSNFYYEDTINQSHILDNAEKFIMKELKPIENILIDFNFESEDDKTPLISFDDFSTYTIKIVDNVLIITDSFYCWEDLVIQHIEILDLLAKIQNKPYVLEYQNLKKLEILTRINNILELSK